MNFDEDDDTDFSLSPQSSSNNKLASLFKMSNDTTGQSNDSLKYKAPKQPQQVQQTASNQQQSQMMFFSHVQAFKYLNNHYEPQGKLGLVVLSSQNTYKLVLYVIKTQPTAMIKITPEFKIALQKNNYLSFYDESRQLWSILFESEENVVQFATQIALCKCNMMLNNIENVNLVQDLIINTDTDSLVVESGDSVEIETLVTLFKDTKLADVIENTQKKSFKLKLGKNKLPKRVEDLIINMKQNERKLLVLTGNMLAPFYTNLIQPNSIVFYDITILKIKKSEKKDRSTSNVNDQMALPPLMTTSTESDSPRSRTESVRDKTKLLNEQLNDPKLDKAKLISRMARMGQPMLPQMTASSSSPQPSGGVIYGVEDEDWENQQLNSMQEAANKTAILMQQQQQQQFLQQQLQQQQIVYQNQLANNNQLALFKSPASVQNQLFYPQQQQTVTQPQLQAEPPRNDMVLNKLEHLNDKIDSLKQITQLNNQNMPSMETNILLQNIQRIVKENEQYKKDLYEKSNKIEEQNTKITELLMKAQNYVEQSHQILELKNSAFQTNAEKTVNKVLELEQDKMRLTGDLSKLTAQISELNLEVNKMQKSEAELKQQLSEVSKNTDMHKQTTERLLVENADLQTKLDTIGAEFKKERQLRKSLETKVNLNDDELNDLRSNLTNNQRLVDEKKRKYELERAQFDRELEDMKILHAKEIVDLKEKLNAFRTKGSEAQNEQIKQVEFDLNREWQSKLDKSVQQSEQKFERQMNVLNDEKKDIERQLNDSKELVKNLRFNLSKSGADIESLKQRLEDLNLIKEKYERLQSKALQMKETYDTRIKELLDAEPDPEIIAEELKKVMNLIFRQLKRHIKTDEYYAGNGVLSGMLKIIKMYTLRILQPNEEEYEEEDYFSQHIFKVPEPVIIQQQQQQPTSPRVLESQISQPVQVMNEMSPKQQAFDQIDTVKSVHEIEAPKQVETSFQLDNNVVFSQLINSNNDDEDEDEDDDDRSIQLINDEEDEEQSKISLTKSVIDPLNILNKQQIEEEKEENLTKSVIDPLLNNNQQVDEEEESNVNEPLTKSVTSSKGEKEIKIDNREEKENNEELDIYDNQIPVETIGQISPLQEDMIETKEEETKVNEQLPLEINETIKQPPKLSKGLFDSEDEERDDEENAKLFSNPITTSVSKLESTTGTTSSTAIASTTSASLKFSPPPLFENDDDSNEKEEIDWFK